MQQVELTNYQVPSLPRMRVQFSYEIICLRFALP